MNPLQSLSITFVNQLGEHMPKQGWSKWGGPRYGLLKEELSEWYCQICGEKQTITLPSYMLPTDESNRDFVRICTACKAKANLKKITLCWELIKIVKYDY